MQTILGGGGAIGNELAKELRPYTIRIRIVARNPKKVDEDNETFAADLTKQDEVMKAVEGSEVVYLVAGFKYKLKIWQQQWPVVMRNVIEACAAYNAKLVFFDNVYPYDGQSVPHLTENTPINPPSRKGKVRAEIAEMVLDAIRSGKITALIARAADFYGPGIRTSVLQETVYNNLKKVRLHTGWATQIKFIHLPIRQTQQKQQHCLAIPPMHTIRYGIFQPAVKS
jgi:nucleoside-diphosphate-sugar epimerase